ncbi:MAG TPA: alpha/beta hydrolase [Chthoniobacterales bacterium]|nr:alpha/beta hydrolase [Chthoniobacterales bacterium]
MKILKTNYSLRYFSIAMTLLLCNCSRPGGNEVSAAGSHYVWQKPGNKVVIVFVHGFTGDCVSTWTNPDTKAYWPDLIKDGPDFDGTDIYVWQYPSSLFGTSPSIDELAEAMGNELHDVGLFKYRDIVFISHSMGGLVPVRS